VKLEVEGFSLVLPVEAEEAVALRASLNAYLRWINSTIRLISTVVEQA
jgi:tRNA threonylcarbamoyladenosine modification (KEOPS) complex  Pcc1 subunit